MPKISESNKVATAWADLTLQILKSTPGGTPTFNSRFLGYAGLAMYESIAGVHKSYPSFQPRLNGLKDLPKAPQNLNLNLSLNASQAKIIKSILWYTNKDNLSKIDSLENYFNKEEFKLFGNTQYNSSINYGRSIADKIFEWSKIDGGHDMQYLIDSVYQFPQTKGSWKVPRFGQSSILFPLHPNWGKNRTFLLSNQNMQVPKFMKYDYVKGSEYFNEMKAVYDKSKNLTQEEKEIAAWWSDDPSETFSPPAHSYSIANISVKTFNADIFKAAQSYALVGMAVADAFVNCWKCKYTYNAERPFAFIFYNIDNLSDLYWPEPPFPAFYSGHASQAAAASVVLENLYGTNVSIIDNSHEGRPMDMQRLIEFKSRKFNSYWAIAEESANSRFYGGIHTCYDNQVGLTEGGKIGKNINELIRHIN